MKSALLALPLLAAPPVLPCPAPVLTAGELHGGCVRYLAHAPATSNYWDGLDAICAVRAAALLAMDAVEATVQDTDRSRSRTRRFCLAEGIWQGPGDNGLLLAQTFILYVEAHPAVRDNSADDVFELALAERWPCPAPGG